MQCRSRVKMPQELVKQHVTHPKREDMPRAQQPPVDMLQRRSDGASHRQPRVRSQEAMEFSKGPPHETGASTHQPKQKTQAHATITGTHKQNRSHTKNHGRQRYIQNANKCADPKECRAQTRTCNKAGRQPRKHTNIRSHTQQREDMTRMHSKHV